MPGVGVFLSCLCLFAAYIPDFPLLVHDVLTWAATIKEHHLPPHAPLFLYGESLGGAISLHAALAEPHAFAGLTLFAPMVGVTADRTPSYLVVKLGE